MPRTLQQKLRSALKRHEQILSKYDGNHSFILVKASDYRRTNNSSLKDIYNDHRNLNRLEKTIRDLRISILDDDDKNKEERENDDDDAVVVDGCGSITSRMSESIARPPPQDHQEESTTTSSEIFVRGGDTTAAVNHSNLCGDQQRHTRNTFDVELSDDDNGAFHINHGIQ